MRESALIYWGIDTTRQRADNYAVNPAQIDEDQDPADMDANPDLIDRLFESATNSASEASEDSTDPEHAEPHDAAPIDADRERVVD